MDYLKVFTSFAEIIEPLADDERGRLFTAMLMYADSGEVPVLAGNERFVWPIAKQGIDRTAETAAINARCGSAGGKRTQAKASELKRTQAKASETEREQADSSHKDNIKDNDKDNISTIVDIKETAAVDGGGWGLTEQEIAESLNRDRAIEDACRDYGLPCEAGHMIHARDLADQYTLDWLLKAIEIGGSNKQTASWRYVEGVLRKAKERGGIDKPAPSASKAPAKVLNAQNYEQRNYTDEETQKAAMMAWASVDDDWS